MVKNRADNVKKWRIDELAAILMRQFKRLFVNKGLDLTEAEIVSIAENAVARQIDQGRIAELRVALVELIEESVQVLKRWNLSYAESLKTEMNQLPGWETTADFLELANEKVNAELRISAGSALVAVLGDTRHADYLLQTVEHGINDSEDVDAVIARRALAFASGIDENAPDFVSRAREWVATNR